MRLLGVFGRVIAFEAAGAWSCLWLAQATGLPQGNAYVGGAVLGLLACAFAPRNLLLRLRVAALGAFGGRDLVYLAADYRVPGPEAPALHPAWRAEHERLCRQCDERARA